MYNTLLLKIVCGSRRLNSFLLHFSNLVKPSGQVDYRLLHPKSFYFFKYIFLRKNYKNFTINYYFVLSSEIWLNFINASNCAIPPVSCPLRDKTIVEY